MIVLFFASFARYSMQYCPAGIVPRMRVGSSTLCEMVGGKPAISYLMGGMPSDAVGSAIVYFVSFVEDDIAGDGVVKGYRIDDGDAEAGDCCLWGCCGISRCVGHHRCAK